MDIYLYPAETPEGNIQIMSPSELCGLGRYDLPLLGAGD